MKKTQRYMGVLSASLLLATGCSENEFLLRLNNSVAVTVGDFDQVAAPLNRMVVKHADYDGVISTTTWDPNYEGLSALDVEGLFASLEEMMNHDAIFVASGTRGLGLRQYNGLSDDNQIISSEEAINNTREFVARGNTLLVTDWGYDLVEAVWPEYITFVHEETGFDAAQRGTEGDIQGSVVDETLAVAIETDALELSYNFSNWSVIESVNESVDVLVRGDVTYLDPNGTGTVDISQAPLLVRFEPPGGLGGQVVFSTFHVDAQNDYVIDEMLRSVVGRFKENDPEAVGYMP
jgi:hypothetical protein